MNPLFENQAANIRTAIKRLLQGTAVTLLCLVPAAGAQDSPSPGSTVIVERDGPVTLFSARADGEGVSLSWETAPGSGTVGFDLYRTASGEAGYALLNERLLLSHAALPRQGSFIFRDNLGARGGAASYVLEELRANGSRRVLGPYEVGLAPSRAKKRAARLTPTVAPLGLPGILRIGVRGPGLHYLAAARIAPYLGLGEDEVRRLIGDYRLTLKRAGVDVAYKRAGKSRGILFFGREAPYSPYTDENVYLLTVGGGKRMARLDGYGPTPVKRMQSFQAVLHLEEDRWAVPALFDDPGADYWVWDQIVAGYPEEETRRFEFRPERLAPVEGEASARLRLVASTPSGAGQGYHARVAVNGVDVGACSWDGGETECGVTFPQALLSPEINALDVTGFLEVGEPLGVFFVDSIDISYGKRYRATGDALACTGGGNRVLTVRGFTGPRVFVLDLSDPDRPVIVRAKTLDRVRDRYRVSFVPSSPETPYRAVTRAAAREPVLSGLPPSVLRGKRNRADYLVIAPRDLLESAQLLAEYRQGQGFETMVVDVQRVGMEFGQGVVSPLAMKRFLATALMAWDLPPRYVVFFGEGTYDYRDIGGQGDNLVPTAMVATPYGLAASDVWMGDVEGDDGVPEVAVGRVPVLTAEESADYLVKLSTFEATGGSTTRALFVADDADEAGDFPADSDFVAGVLPSWLPLERAYLGSLTVDEARQAVRDGLEEGAAFLNYIGHAGLDRLAMEGLLVSADVAGLAASPRPPAITAMTCVAGQFSIPGYDSLSELLVTAPETGATALWAPTGFSVNDRARVLDEEFFRGIFELGDRTMGEAVVGAMARYRDRLGTDFMLWIYNLQGDPAVRFDDLDG